MIVAIRTLAIAGLAGGVLAIAGCNSQSDTVVAENASVQDVAKQVSKADLKPRPGRWESRLEITKMEMAGIPQQVQEMMKGQLGEAKTSVSCLTPEQAEAANGEFFKPENDEACKYNSFRMGGGKIEADMTCSEKGTSQNLKMSGTYSRDAYDMQMSSEGTIDGNPVSMVMKVGATRVGECDGTEPS